jgi:hypothetical protein
MFQQWHVRFSILVRCIPSRDHTSAIFSAIRVSFMPEFFPPLTLAMIPSGKPNGLLTSWLSTMTTSLHEALTLDFPSAPTKRHIEEIRQEPLMSICRAH